MAAQKYFKSKTGNTFRRLKIETEMCPLNTLDIFDTVSDINCRYF